MSTIKEEMSDSTGDEVVVSRSSGENEPGHYKLKIEAFSLLSLAGIFKYESEVFEVGGHKWRLLLYPKGIEDEGVLEHISLYLEIADTASLPHGWSIHAYLKFFVYDHIRNNYLTIRDLDGRKRHFHALNTKSGFAKLLSLGSFKNKSNGYISNDSCLFGVEVFVTPNYAATENCLSLVEPSSANNTYTWIIKEFSTITKDSICSEEFKVGKLKWKIWLYPKGSRSPNNQISIFLSVSSCSLFPIGWKHFAKFKLLLKDQVGFNHIEKEASYWFCDKMLAWGYYNFLPLSDLKGGLKVNDTLIIEAQILLVGILRNFT